MLSCLRVCPSFNSPAKPTRQTKDVVEYKRHLADTVRKEGGALKLGKLDVISNPTLAEDLAVSIPGMQKTDLVDPRCSNPLVGI